MRQVFFCFFRLRRQSAQLERGTDLMGTFFIPSLPRLPVFCALFLPSRCALLVVLHSLCVYFPLHWHIRIHDRSIRSWSAVYVCARLFRRSALLLLRDLRTTASFIASVAANLEARQMYSESERKRGELLVARPAAGHTRQKGRCN